MGEENQLLRLSSDLYMQAMAQLHILPNPPKILTLNIFKSVEIESANKQLDFVGTIFQEDFI